MPATPICYLQFKTGGRQNDRLMWTVSYLVAVAVSDATLSRCFQKAAAVGENNHQQFSSILMLIFGGAQVPGDPNGSGLKTREYDGWLFLQCSHGKPELWCLIYSGRSWERSHRREMCCGSVEPSGWSKWDAIMTDLKKWKRGASESQIVSKAFCGFLVEMSLTFSFLLVRFFSKNTHLKMTAAFQESSDIKSRMNKCVKRSRFQTETREKGQDLLRDCSLLPA